MQYRREIDGLRAVAVMPVILFHAGFGTFSGGYVGVDVFFVISGYLITTILLTDLERGQFSIIRFYERRARRILPTLFIVILACLPFAYMWMLPSQLADFSRSIIAVVFFVSNILFWSEADYFAPAAELKPLLHTWSLAVEEQYYLIFPLFLLALWRFGRRAVFWCIIGIALFSLILAEWGWRNSPSANFYLAPTRAWELLVGSITAFLTVGRGQRRSDVLSLIGLALIIFAIFAYDNDTPFPSLYALAPVVGTALIILFAARETWVARLLSTAPFVGIGLISYSAYLWHQPLFAFARLRSPTEPGQTLMIGLALLALLLAWGTWHWVEQPFRRRARPLLPTRMALFSASGATAAAFASLGLAGHLGNGFDWRWTQQQNEVIAYLEYPRQDYYREGTCFLGPRQTYRDFLPECYENAEEIIIGDSYAAAFSSALKGAEGMGQLTASGCPAAFGFRVSWRAGCVGINDFTRSLLLDAQPRVVYLHSDWSLYWETSGFVDKLAATVEELRAAGIGVVLIGSVPQWRLSLPQQVLFQKIPLVVGARAASEIDHLREINSVLSQIADTEDAIFMDPIRLLCDAGGSCTSVVASVERHAPDSSVSLIAWDNGHLTFSGARYLLGRLQAAYAFHDPRRVE